MITELLKLAAAAVQNGMWDTKWQNAEAETIASQTILACWNNLENHGEALSWLGSNAIRGRAMCGTNNARGIVMLIDDGSLIREAYSGPLTAPYGTVTEDGKPVCLRCSERLLHYAVSQKA